MAITYDPLATITLGSAATSINFTSIPNTYTDLRVVLTLKSASGVNVHLRFNSDSGSNYSRTYLYGRGSSAASARGTSQVFSIISDDGVGTTPHLYTLDVFSYAGSTFKTWLSTASEDNNGSGSVANYVGLWRSTSAITEINFITNSANTFDAGCTATLYGIKKA
jgi:hypothetical protein